MELKKGYKKTEMGPIPSDWDVREFVEVMDGFTSGQTPYRGVASYFTGNIPWITSGELNYNVITDTHEKITPEGVKDANLKIIPKGTFLFAITGLEAEGTRGSCAITGVESTTNQSCMALYPKKDLLITSYLYHYYVRYGNELALKYCQGTKQQSYTGGTAKKLPIILPPTIKEQTAIATALSDTDALISSLEKLIAKKSNIKQGVMQKLLKPKKEWETKKLGELFVIRAGGDLNESNFSATKNQKYRYPVYSNALTNKGLYGYTSEYEQMENTITVTARGHVGVAHPRGHKYLAIGRVIVLKPIAEINIYYISEYINNFIKFNNESTGVPQLTAPQISAYEVIMPDLESQNVISGILSDMDSELMLLKSKLEKYRQIKTGMMQNLLTGKIRLV